MKKDSDVTLQIKEEQLDIAKKWMQTDEVKVYREVFKEEKLFTVPVERIELVIENKTKEAPDQIIRIPLSEERVEFSKHKVTLEDVSIYKEKIEDIKHIEETLKREKVKVKISGSLKVKQS